jgi:NTP pyrophosphatase (non-canonical NTP hydrolase)
MDSTTLTLRAFQQHIKEKYFATDVARGTPATWMWFTEEVGELASALAGKTDANNLSEEFADVLAWLCTLANINDIDLADAIEEKYFSDGGPSGVK